MKASLNALHHQGNDWRRELDFYIDDLAILTKRLQKPNGTGAGKKNSAPGEKFLNKFIQLRKRIDVINHDIELREKKIEQAAKTKPGAIIGPVEVTDDKIMSHMQELSASIASTRFEFNQYLAKIL